MANLKSRENAQTQFLGNDWQTLTDFGLFTAAYYEMSCRRSGELHTICCHIASDMLPHYLGKFE